MVICLWMGKTYTAKTPLDDFKVTTPENLLLSKQAVISKGIPVPYTNLQLNHFPKIDLFCNDNISFQCMAPNMWLTNCTDPSTGLQSPTREGCWLQISSVYHTMKIVKLLSHKILRCTKHSSFLKRMKN